ncbi:MAG: PEP-CTERM sorting domain-containing protein [Akkermansiaceae bacterium]|nr:PEP-CTERM sorting domain-containing protein [Akkermansiaceae bacterium]NNM30993.1 PEP-CTERM sorting domain-containing protein [Akkermansiaceae bacterium]
MKSVPQPQSVTKRRFFAPALATAVVSFAFAETGSAANILLNPGFELGTGSDATDWTEFDSPPAGSTMRSSLSPNSGGFHMYMQVDNLNNPPQGVALFAEQNQGANTVDNTLNYNLSFFAKTDTTDFTGVNIFYQILWLDQDGSDGGGVKGETLTSLLGEGINTSYQQFGVTDQDIPDGADSFLLRFQLSAGAIPDIVQGAYFDDVVLEIVPEPASLSLLALGGLVLFGRRRRA